MRCWLLSQVHLSETLAPFSTHIKNRLNQIPNNSTNSNSIKPIFKQVAKPSSVELQQVVDNISLKVAKRLEKLGYIERDMDNCYLSFDDELSARCEIYPVKLCRQGAIFSLL